MESPALIAGTLYLVATPIGNLEDITLRALRVLRECAVVAAEDTRHSGQLLKHFGISKPLVSCFQFNEARRSEEIIERLRRGEIVALVTDAGSPGISDPGARVVEAALRAGLRVEPVPGPCALVAALTASGLRPRSSISSDSCRTNPASGGPGWNRSSRCRARWCSTSRRTAFKNCWRNSTPYFRTAPSFWPGNSPRSSRNSFAANPRSCWPWPRSARSRANSSSWSGRRNSSPGRGSLPQEV